MWLHADIKSIPDIVRHYGRTAADRTALIEAGRRITFAELDRSTSRMARAMRRRGVGEGSVIAFIGKNSVPFFEALFGAGKAGCTMLPLNWRLVPAELTAIVQDAQPPSSSSTGSSRPRSKRSPTAALRSSRSWPSTRPPASTAA
jgi:acyl-CoA synthetase (AMP-forming)/AMP-acid ligase II